jgi:hypothetical protein
MKIVSRQERHCMPVLARFVFELFGLLRGG